ncbi:hypothetical protein NEPAR06_1661 [Nematocida parisii]|uniref:Uncharacterized protein n=1 Tax=Nematocida parisii (strain ERTm3) TaxID=935791 RepID=I3EKG7_NEMP3|nr:uncharacterized protein NEPG_00749 [Nematocida parisii ERTm1]EIJ89714.1 hypothetical protein NEQG_00484 [Nematocida parisii ERTm3]KAI5145408.1 hypothetical protein NEPAR07_1659 [Nematocida parisii]EIJ94083.1 hypothetical protein NEPG_00749 [Nematocida parisii ERTm1]KAI5155242.1 hypothetical protein NEPAR06_1661 [Nematocida parisii]KAI5158004.1 hypothetical protein NEPAR05_1781 [Nematocida parisii]|eukprot:XP_013058579.1 hypothetical protein NEPG_00749 [Nematocida parisii ERTm1]
MKLYELRGEVNNIAARLEKDILSGEKPAAGGLESIRDNVKRIYGEVYQMEAASEYLIIDRHAVGMDIARALLLVRILDPKIDIDIPLSALQHNIKPTISQLSSKEILVEAIYIYIVTNQHTQGMIEAVRILKNKMLIKKTITNCESALDRFILESVDKIVETKVENILPIAQCETDNDLILALNTILEVNNLKYIEDVLLNNVYPTVDIRNVLRQLILIDNIDIKSEMLEIYHLVLRILFQYIQMRKRKDIFKSKDVIYEVLDDDCVGIMVRILEKDNVPSKIRVEVMNILIESDIQTINYSHINIDNSNLVPFIRYVVKNPEQIRLLVEILESLEIEIGEDGNEAEMSSLIVVMDFLNIILKTYTDNSSDGVEGVSVEGDLSTRSDAGIESVFTDMNEMHMKPTMSTVRMSLNSTVSIEKYIGNSIVEVYNSIIPNFSNPLVIYTYLTIFCQLISDGQADSGYYKNLNNKNSLLSHSTTALGTILRTLSMYVVQDSMLYAEVPAVKLYDLNSPYSAICTSELHADKNILLESIQMLFSIILQLPEQIKSAINTSYVLNIVFRVVSKNTESIPRNVLEFIRGFFSASILHKLANSIGGNLYPFISILTNKGELETVYNLVQNSNKLYKGILQKDIITEDVFLEYKNTNILYSLIGAMIVQYYTEHSTLNNPEINKKISIIYNLVLSNIKRSPNISFLKESKEFGYFFKILCIVGKPLELDCTELLSTVLSVTGNTGASVNQCLSSVLYTCDSRNIAELYYFYHFIYKGIKENTKLIMGKDAPEEKDLLCLTELHNPYSSNTIRYLALLGLNGHDVKNPGSKKAYMDLDLSSVSVNEKGLFINQIYRALFLSGQIQTANHSFYAPHSIIKNRNDSLSTSQEQSKPNEYQPAEYAYADMAIRSAIKATRDTGVPKTLPHTVLALGEPRLVSALLYTLYDKAPNSAIIQSYIKKMRKYTKNDNTIFSRVLSHVSL